jgi:hypothetical protein
MGLDILAVNERVVFDDSIANLEYHTQTPYGSTRYGNNDEIRIAVQQQDVYTLPCESFLYVEGRLTKKDGTKLENYDDLRLSNNAIAFLFEEIRFEMSGVEVDRTRRVGITTTIKNLLSLDDVEEKTKTINACWTHPSSANTKLKSMINTGQGSFNFLLPLKMLMGFAEDYTRIVINVKQELILLRAATDADALYYSKPITAASPAPTDYKITLEKVYWKIPYVQPSDAQKLILLRHLEENRPLVVPFRSWELHEYPLLPKSKQQSWSIKTTTQLEKPRYVVLAFQTARKGKLEKQPAEFDHCALRNAKLYLNSQYYPYDNLNLSFTNNRYGLLYDMYSRFKSSYYDDGDGCSKCITPTMTPEEFKTYAPLVVIDCSKQYESIKSSTIDVRLEFESENEFPDNTTAFCLILHDVIFEYAPLTGTVQRLT